MKKIIGTIILKNIINIEVNKLFSSILKDTNYINIDNLYRYDYIK